MSTKAIPGFGGKCFKKAVNASNPPADAPIPTIGNNCLGVFEGWVFSFLASVFGGSLERGAGFGDFDGLERFLLIQISCGLGTTNFHGAHICFGRK
jgi:hypothetical protein